MCARAQVELLDLTCSLEKLRDCFALMIEVVRGTRQKRRDILRRLHADLAWLRALN